MVGRREAYDGERWTNGRVVDQVSATRSAEDLAHVIDAYPPGTEGRYYLVHMDLMAGRVDFADALTQRGYRSLQTSCVNMRLDAEGAFCGALVKDPDTPGETLHPAVHLIPDGEACPRLT
jgi:hypothetical protein